MTAQDDQEFYEKRDRFLGYVQAGTATQEQIDWLMQWLFLEWPKVKRVKKPEMSARQVRPGKRASIEIVYRYRGPMKATPFAQAKGTGVKGRKGRKKRKKVKGV